MNANRGLVGKYSLTKLLSHTHICVYLVLKHIIADEEYCRSISSFAGKFVDAVFIKDEKDRSGSVFVMFLPEVVNHVVSAGLAKVCFEGLF